MLIGGVLWVWDDDMDIIPLKKSRMTPERRDALNRAWWRARDRERDRAGQREGAKAIAAEIPQPEGRGIEAESAVPVIRHSPKEPHQH